MDAGKTGALLRALRREKGLTQEQAAERFRVSRRTVSRWETGSNLPDLTILIEMADFYELDLRELLEGERKAERDGQGIGADGAQGRGLQRGGETKAREKDAPSLSVWRGGFRRLCGSSIPRPGRRRFRRVLRRRPDGRDDRGSPDDKPSCRAHPGLEMEALFPEKAIRGGLRKKKPRNIRR